jgi:transglutaminase-like putative cysteine protease
MNACVEPADIDAQRIAWSQVTRACFQVHQRFHYVYPGPIRALRQRLVVIPAAHYGTQRLCSHQLTVTPTPGVSRRTTDAFGNHVVELEFPAPGASVAFEVRLTIEHDVHRPGATGCSAEAAPRFLAPTRLTAADAGMVQLARRWRAHAHDPAALAQHVAAWVANTMRYAAGVTTVQTTAAEALALRRGLCQDYAHVMIALCRAAGVAARYVSGHVLGEGGSHAWVEVLLPDGEGYRVQAYDPTNGRRRHLGYMTIAVGRDYRDVAPVSGVYLAPYPGQLSWSKQARITRLVCADGDTVGPDRA